MPGKHFSAQEETGRGIKTERILTAVKSQLSTPRKSLIHFGMSHKIVAQTVGYHRSLINNRYPGRHETLNQRQQEGIVGTAQNQRVGFRSAAEKSGQILSHKKLGPL